MTPEHRDAYLQRNREYRRKRKNSGTNGDIVQSAHISTETEGTATHICTGTEGTATHISTGTEWIFFAVYVFCLFFK
jgi:hypothetical protein